MGDLLVNGAPIPYDTVPVAYMASGVRRYFESHQKVGGFLTALLCNNLRETLTHADDTNARFIKEWVQWLYNHAPARSWGSEEHHAAWLAGRRAAA